MNSLTYRVQPTQGHYVDLITELFHEVHPERLSAAVAYVTTGGVGVLQSALATDQYWIDSEKRWLVAMDYCRSDPSALDTLALLPNSTVRIPDGDRVVQRRLCTPYSPFHPKMYLATAADCYSVVAGSGNLSRNGLTGGVEVGSLLLVKEPMEEEDNPLLEQCLALWDWFDGAWNVATRYEDVSSEYRTRVAELPTQATPPPTEDDAVPSAHPPRTFQETRLRALRSAESLWIEAGNLHENRGPGRPGNQLMMSAYSRVFFGRAAEVVPIDSHLGVVKVQFTGNSQRDCTLRYSNNSMDVLTLPIPNDGGPGSYDQETLLFEKEGLATGIQYKLRLGRGTEKRGWIAKSRNSGSLFTMTSGRKWGVF